MNIILYTLLELRLSVAPQRVEEARQLQRLAVGLVGFWVVLEHVAEELREVVSEVVR